MAESMDIDVDYRYEFCAPMFYDFRYEETDADIAAAERWFDSALPYEASRVYFNPLLRYICYFSGGKVSVSRERERERERERDLIALFLAMLRCSTCCKDQVDSGALLGCFQLRSWWQS
jgi:hypothetical protein